MATEYRVVFSGKIIDGFTIEAVKLSAAVRLKATPEQMERLFSGRTAVLKKNLSHELAERYVVELQRIGMMAKLEDTSKTSPAQKATQAPPAVKSVAISTDLEKTQLASADALSRYLSEEPSSPQTPISIEPRKEVAELTPQDTAFSAAPTQSNEATLIVPRNKLDEIKGHLAQTMQGAPGGNPANTPTLIVPRAPTSSKATIVTQEGTEKLRKSPSPTAAHDPQRTLIANADALEAYLAANSGSSPLGHMVTTDIRQAAHIPGSEHLQESNTHTPHDLQRTLIANSDALNTYLADNAEPSPTAINAGSETRPQSGSEETQERRKRPRHPAAELVKGLPMQPFQAHSVKDATEWVGSEDNAEDPAKRRTKFSLPALRNSFFLLIFICLFGLAIWFIS